MHRSPFLFLSEQSRKIILLLSLGIIFIVGCNSSEATRPDAPKVRADARFFSNLVVAKPLPDYPAEAVRRSWSGYGVFELIFRRDGSVKEALTILTTGHDILDEAARAALLRWRCKPGTIWRVRMAMSFSAGDEPVEIDPRSDPKKQYYMTRAPRPQYPYVARLERWSGFGVYVIRFAPDGTATKVVVLKSTGRAALDNACLGTLRMWRCQPGFYTTVVIPITFTMGGGPAPH